MAADSSSAAGSGGPIAAEAAARSEADRRVTALGQHLRLQTDNGNPGLTSLSTKIEEMKRQQAIMRAERKRAAKDLKNAQRRKRRLKGKARQLSNEDLLAVLLMRQEQAEGSGGDDDVGAPGGSSSSGTPPAPPASKE